CSINCLFPILSIFRSKAFEAFLPRVFVTNRKLIKSIPFVRQIERFVRFDVPNETASVRLLLRFGQTPLAERQLILRHFSLDRYPSQMRDLSDDFLVACAGFSRLP